MKKKIFLAATLICSLLFISIVYRDIVLSPNSVLLSQYVDGTVNYYNFINHVKHDSSPLVCGGLNYPRGECVTYTDCFPVFSSTLLLASKIFPSLPDHSVAFLNLLLLFSIALSALFLYLILYHFTSSALFSFIGSFSISMLSSHVFLWFFGHYALSLQWPFTLAWWLMIKFRHTGSKVLVSSCIIIITTLLFFTHSYLGAMVISFNFLVMCFEFMKKERRDSLLNLLQVVIPLSLYALFQVYADTHASRPVMSLSPEHRATFASIFLPRHGGLLQPLFAIVFDYNSLDQYSWNQIGNYVGLSTLLVSIIALFSRTRERASWKDLLMNLFSPSGYSVWMLPSLLILLYAMGVHFFLHLDGLVSLLPMATQVIAIGRFAWVFYFVFTVWGVIMMHRAYTRSKAGKIFSLAFLLLLLGEGTSQQIFMSRNIQLSPNVFSEQNMPGNLYGVLHSGRIDFSRYQAIIPLPFYNKYFTPCFKDGSLRSTNESLALSYYTGLPLVSIFSSRPSSLESEHTQSLFSGNLDGFFKAPYLGKPYLVFYTREVLPADEQLFLSCCSLLYENQAVAMYSLSPATGVK